MKLRIAVIVLVVVLGRVGLAQAPEDDEGEQVKKALAAQGLKPPTLGWVLPTGEVVTEVAAPEITVLMEKEKPLVMPKVGVIPASAAKAFVMRHKVDCDQTDDPEAAPIYRYSGGLAPRKYTVQVLVFPGRLTVPMMAGFAAYEPTEAQATAVWKALKATAGQKRRLEAIRQAGRTDFFIFAAIYGKNLAMTRQGTFLVGQDGTILGSKMEDVTQEGVCDGCEVPKYQDGLGSRRSAENILTVPGLDFPMLLEETSTLEIRATSLLTFSGNGRASEYRPYEYVVNCFTH